MSRSSLDPAGEHLGAGAEGPSGVRTGICEISAVRLCLIDRLSPMREKRGRI
jgi:hypothetical protein